MYFLKKKGINVDPQMKKKKKSTTSEVVWALFKVETHFDLYHTNVVMVIHEYNNDGIQEGAQLEK